MTSAVESGSEGWFFAATNGNPPSWDWLVFNELSTDVACGNLPHAASPCTACEVSFVSGPVKVFGSAAAHAVAGRARYASHMPFAHCWVISHEMAAETRTSDAGTFAALSASRASPWRNAPSKVGSDKPKSPLSGPP